MKKLKPVNYKDKQRKLDQIKQQNTGKTYVYTDALLPELTNKLKQAKGDVYFNKLHLSSFSGLINDPNNFVYHNEKYYIFYQWNPFTPIHANKHQGYFTTKNFLEYKSHGLGIRPSNEYDANGVYSGSALSEDNNLYLYYTGNVKKGNIYNAPEDTSHTLVAKYSNDWKETEASKKLLFSVDKTKYTRHFRDPYIVQVEDTYYLLHGAQTLDKKGKIVVYSSDKPNADFTWKGEIEFINGPKQLNEAFMFECPSFTKIHNKDVLFISTQGAYFYDQDNQNRDVSIYLLGKMNWKTLTFTVTHWDLLDLGFDYYAPQIMNGPDYYYNLSIAWAGTPDTDAVATFEQGYAHSLTLPRTMWIEKGKLYQKYSDNFNFIYQPYYRITDSIVDLWNRQNFLHLKPSGKKWVFEFKNEEGHYIMFSYFNGVLTIDRTNMSHSFAPNYPNKITRNIKNIKDIEIIQDSSLLELYINQGEYVITTKYFLDGELLFQYDGNITATIGELDEVDIDWGDRPQLLVPGEALYDEYHLGNGKIKVNVGGASLNVAAAIQKTKRTAIFVGAVGFADSTNLLLSVSMDKLDPDNFIKIKDKNTTKAIVSLDENGERSFEFVRGADADLKYEYVENIYFDALVLTSATAFLGGELFETYKNLALKAKMENKKIFFDPNYRKALYQNNLDDFIAKAKEFINLADFIKFSEDELYLITNTNTLKDGIKALENFKNKLFLITLGEKGTLVYKDSKHFLVESKKVKQIDSTGAGDAFFGTFIGKWFDTKQANSKEVVIDEDLINIVFHANLVAGYVVTKVGASFSLLEIENHDFKAKRLRKNLLKRFKEEF